MVASRGEGRGFSGEETVERLPLPAHRQPLAAESGEPTADRVGALLAPRSSPLVLTINGVPQHLAVAGHETLLGVLRERLQLTGTKLACGRGECGACTVLLDAGDGPEPAYACLTLAAACEGVAVTTVEGLAAPGTLHPLQEAFVRHDALQCGYCTPGQLMAAAALLAQDASPTEEAARRAMAGNLCRCGAQPNIVAAVLDTAAALRTTPP